MSRSPPNNDSSSLRSLPCLLPSNSTGNQAGSDFDSSGQEVRSTVLPRPARLSESGQKHVVQHLVKIFQSIDSHTRKKENNGSNDDSDEWAPPHFWINMDAKDLHMGFTAMKTPEIQNSVSCRKAHRQMKAQKRRNCIELHKEIIVDLIVKTSSSRSSSHSSRKPANGTTKNTDEADEDAYMLDDYDKRRKKMKLNTSFGAGKAQITQPSFSRASTSKLNLKLLRKKTQSTVDRQQQRCQREARAVSAKGHNSVTSTLNRTLSSQSRQTKMNPQMNSQHLKIPQQNVQENSMKGIRELTSQAQPQIPSQTFLSYRSKRQPNATGSENLEEQRAAEEEKQEHGSAQIALATATDSKEQASQLRKLPLKRCTTDVKIRQNCQIRPTTALIGSVGSRLGTTFAAPPDVQSSRNDLQLLSVVNPSQSVQVLEHIENNEENYNQSQVRSTLQSSLQGIMRRLSEKGSQQQMLLQGTNHRNLKKQVTATTCSTAGKLFRIRSSQAPKNTVQTSGHEDVQRKPTRQQPQAELNQRADASFQERQPQLQPDEIEKLRQFKDSLLRQIQMDLPNELRSESKIISQLTHALHQKSQNIPTHAVDAKRKSKVQIKQNNLIHYVRENTNQTVLGGGRKVYSLKKRSSQVQRTHLVPQQKSQDEWHHVYDLSKTSQKGPNGGISRLPTKTDHLAQSQDFKQLPFDYCNSSPILAINRLSEDDFVSVYRQDDQSWSASVPLEHQKLLFNKLQGRQAQKKTLQGVNIHGSLKQKRSLSSLIAVDEGDSAHQRELQQHLAQIRLQKKVELGQPEALKVHRMQMSQSALYLATDESSPSRNARRRIISTDSGLVSAQHQVTASQQEQSQKGNNIMSGTALIKQDLIQRSLKILRQIKGSSKQVKRQNQLRVASTSYDRKKLVSAQEEELGQRKSSQEQPKKDSTLLLADQSPQQKVFKELSRSDLSRVIRQSKAGSKQSSNDSILEFFGNRKNRDLQADKLNNRDEKHSKENLSMHKLNMHEGTTKSTPRLKQRNLQMLSKQLGQDQQRQQPQPVTNVQVQVQVFIDKFQLNKANQQLQQQSHNAKTDDRSLGDRNSSQLAQGHHRQPLLNCVQRKQIQQRLTREPFASLTQATP